MDKQINMSDTPRTDSRVFDADLVSAFFARELERELTIECAINKRNCDDWSCDHTYLQNLCRKAGYDENEVEGDSYGIRSITQLADMLMAKIDFPNVGAQRENTLLRDALREALDAAAYTVSVNSFLDPNTRHCQLERLARHRSLLPDAVDVCPDSASA